MGLLEAHKKHQQQQAVRLIGEKKAFIDKRPEDSRSGAWPGVDEIYINNEQASDAFMAYAERQLSMCVPENLSEPAVTLSI